MAEQHDRILGYFLEEASEHLHTIEQGLLKLPETVRDRETIRELFRAAHSIKGSAAMLGLTDVQQVGNQFESNFKLLKDNSQIPVDTQLQSLFLESFGFLQAAINEVRGSKDPYRRNPETPDPVGDPVFEELKAYLQHLLTDRSAIPVAPAVRDLTQEPAVEKVFGDYVTRKLDEITSLCSQPDRAEIRTQIQQICQKLGNLGENFEFLEWTNLFTACRLAIANPQNDLEQLSRTMSIAITRSQLLVLANRHHEIVVTTELAALIDRSASSGSENLSTFKLDPPATPTATIEFDHTTEKLPEIATATTAQLLLPIEPVGVVASTTTNSRHSANNTDVSDNFINLIAEDELCFESNSIELNEFMNSLDLELESNDGTWMADDNFFDAAMPLQNLSSPVIDQQVLQPVSLSLDLDGAPTQQIGGVQYDEETHYNPDLEDRSDLDIPTFWSNAESVVTQQQPLYSDLDLSLNTGYQFQPDPTPAIDLDVSAPDFSLDGRISDLFPHVIVPEADRSVSMEPQINSEELSFGTDFLATPADMFDFTSSDVTEISPQLVATADDLSQNRDHSVPNADWISDVLCLENLNNHLSTEVEGSEDPVTTELTNWIDNSLAQDEVNCFVELDLDLHDSEEPAAEMSIDLLFADFNFDAGNPQNLELDAAIIDAEPNFVDLQSSIIDAEPNFVDLQSSIIDAEPNLVDLQSSIIDAEPNLVDLDFSIADLSDANALIAAELPIMSSESEDRAADSSVVNNFADLDLDLLDSHELVDLSIDRSFDRDFPELDLLDSHELGDLSSDQSSGDEASLPEHLDFADLDLDSINSTESIAELPEISQTSDLDLNLLDESVGAELPDSATLVDLSNLDFNFDSHELGDLSSDQSSGDEASLPEHLDFPDLDLDLINSTESIAELPEISQTSDLDLNLLDESVGAELPDSATLVDLSNLDFNLDSPELTDLDNLLDANPTSNLADAGNLEALLGVAALGMGATALASGNTEFDALDDLIGTPEPTANPAANLDDLDLLLAAPAPVVAAPQVDRSDKKPAERRAKQRTFEQTMRVSVRHLDNLNNLVGELVVNRNTLEQDQNRMRQFVEKLLSEVQKLNEVGKRMQDLYERSLMENSLVASRQQSKPNTTAPSTIPSNLQDLEQPGSLMEYDPLEMDRFTPIHLLSQKMIELTVRIRESTADIEFVVDGSTEVTRTLRQVTGQLQEDLTKSRMVPFAQTADRLQRGVRDNGLKYGKEVELSVEGRDTLIDKVILESLTDPLIHMVNNGIAHGIESTEHRRSIGKPSAGKITIRAIHQGNQTIISISDDGAGINTEHVKAKAIEKGIITAQKAATMSKTEAYELLFLPSFSTKDQADELAGRGVGMDVVRTSLTDIRGTITTESQLGVGTTFTIRLPLALSIAKALIAVNNKINIAFPMDGIEDTQDVSPEQIQTNSSGEQCIFWRDGLMPFKPLSDLLGFNRPLSRNNFYSTNEDDSDLVSILILRSDGNLIAVQVDKIVADQEIVIKPLQGPAPKPLGIAGATVLGDGRIVAIADVMELIALAKGTLTRHVSTQWSNHTDSPVAEMRESMVLIVDDSITVRELLSLTFKRAGYRVEQARDGQEAWDKLRAGLPCDIVFCDIEMPRMDGLEFLSRIQKDVALSKVPVAMLTSRGSDRHRQIAAQLGASGYFIKPYLEEALLDAAKRMIKGEVLAIV